MVVQRVVEMSSATVCNECGIEVYDEMRSNLHWAMSGAVVFCGPSFVGHGKVVRSSIAEVENLDVSVGFQEAMPLATTTTATVVMVFFPELCVPDSILHHHGKF